MTQILVRHTVEDYEAWKPHFDEHDGTREEYGQRGYRLHRSAEDPDDLVMLFDWDSPETARRFLEDSDLEAVMGEAGVVGEPQIAFLEEIESREVGKPAA